MPAARHRRRPHPALAGLLGLLLAGCIVLPRSAEVYDPQCRTYVKQVVLEAAEIGGIGHCVNDGCVVILASLGIITAASAVVSGSVAVIGNIAYWVERRGQCPPVGTASPVPPSASAAMPRPLPVPGMLPLRKGDAGSAAAAQ
ncbi:MAG: hypothetical protein IPH51_15005 [Rubrivivax sp.]|nr:hypothetical protein [Rubrivivax sp.]